MYTHPVILHYFTELWLCKKTPARFCNCLQNNEYILGTVPFMNHWNVWYFIKMIKSGNAEGMYINPVVYIRSDKVPLAIDRLLVSFATRQ